MSTLEHARPADTRSESMTRLKVRLLAEGLRMDASDEDRGSAKPMLRVRSGSCGGLDLLLPDGTWVNCPVRERFAKRSALHLANQGGYLVILGAGEPVPVQLVQAPAYYERLTSSGTPMIRVGQLCSDRVGVGITNVCTFWRSSQSRCRFCSIGHNVRDENARKPADDVVETVVAAIDDPVSPARHVLLGGGTPDDENDGFTRMASIAARIKEQRDISIYAMVSPPRELRHLESLAAAGVDEIGLNIEVFSEDAARRYIPGKFAAIGIAGYWAALERSVELFGALNTRSITVVGLEDVATTVRGVGRLASIGVLPILSPLRPLTGTQLESHPTLSSDALWGLTLAAAEAADAHGVPLGPLCVACQSNTLNLAGDHRYRLY